MIISSSRSTTPVHAGGLPLASSGFSMSRLAVLNASLFSFAHISLVIPQP